MNRTENRPSALSAEQPRPEACCDSVLISTCCPPEAKSACCGQSSQAATCACQSGGSATR
jgi:hypothetical protein